MLFSFRFAMPDYSLSFIYTVCILMLILHLEFHAPISTLLSDILYQPRYNEIHEINPAVPSQYLSLPSVISYIELDLIHLLICIMVICV